MDKETRRELVATIAAKAVTTAVIANNPQLTPLKAKMQVELEKELYNILNILDVTTRAANVLKLVRDKLVGDGEDDK